MEKTVTTRLKLEIGQYLANLGKAAVGTKEFARQVSGHGTAADKHIRSVGTGALVMGAAVAAGVGMAVKAAIDWESAWAGVNKTVDGTAAQMGELKDGLRGLARELPSTHKEIAAVAEAAGQLGIQRDAIVGFTRTMVDLGQTTNLTADEAATSIAQMANIMGTSQFDVDRLGAALVELGNNGASTEAEILAMSLRIAGSGKLIGATEADVLALSNAMASLGIQSELGGGAMSRILQMIYVAVKDGGDKLQAFARISNMSADEFSRKWAADPMRTLDDFIQGLAGVEAGGGNVVAALREVGIKGTQNLQVMLRLVGAGDILTESLEMGSQAWLENTALQEEAAKRYETTASQLGVLRNQIVDVGIDMGGVFLPAIKTATEGLGTMVAGVGELDGAGRNLVVGLATMGGGITGLIGLIGFAGPKIRDFRNGLMEMGSVGQFVGRNLGGISTALLAGAGLLAAYTFHVGQQAKEQALADERTRKYTDAIKEQGSAVGETTDELALLAIVEGKVGVLLRDTGSDLSIFTDAVNLTGSAAADMRDDLQRLEDAARRIELGDVELERFKDLLEETGMAGTDLGDELLRLAQTEGVSGDALGGLIDRIREQSDAYARGKIEARNQADATTAAGDAAGEAVGATEAHAQALNVQTEAAEKAVEALEELIDAERAAVDPLFGMLDATRANRDAQAELAAAFAANNDATADNNVSLEELDRLQQAAAASALDVNAAALQLAGAIEIGSVNVDVAKGMLADWVDQGLITQDTAIRMAQLFDDAATKADVLAGERVVTLTLVDNATGQLNALKALYDSFQDKYISLNINGRPGGIVERPDTRPRRGEPSRWGNVFAYRTGGITPAHVAGPGTLYKYAEPATGGEAFVPRFGNPQRSMGVLDTAAGWYGASVVPGGRFTSGASASGSVTLGGGTPGDVLVKVLLDAAGADRHLKAFLRHLIAVEHGGNVQKALGR